MNRSNESPEAADRTHDVQPIDLVVVNLYPFEQTVAKPNASRSRRAIPP